MGGRVSRVSSGDSTGKCSRMASFPRFGAEITTKSLVSGARRKRRPRGGKVAEIAEGETLQRRFRSEAEMTLQQKLMADLRQAMKQGDNQRRSLLRLVLAGVKNAEIDKGVPLDDSGIVDVISREVKRHRESIAEFSKGNRQDLVAKEEAELAILLEYLPQQMSREEIEEAARSAIEQVGARGPGDKGKVMSQLMPQLKGRAQGREINEVVLELLVGF